MSKKPEGKAEPTLVYPSFILAVSRQRRFGINKHGNSEDWRTTESIEHYDAIMRHMLKILEGENVDQESGELHLTAIATNAMFEIEKTEGNGLLPTRMRKDNLKDVH